MNDGKCDRRGRFWCGTCVSLGQPLEPVCSLYRIEPPSHSVTRVLDGVTISNGLGWSPDGSLLYYIDSPSQRVEVFDFDVESGEISGRRTLLRIDERDGLPDGLAVDAEGCIWVALYGGGAVRRYRPDGRLDGTIELPVTWVTSCAFGGPDLDRLYITSAMHKLDEEGLRREYLAGDLLVVRPGARGLPMQRYDAPR